MTSSLTGGYILPSHTDQPPRNLTLTQFIQTVLVGLTGLSGTLVRPKWQPSPPKQPDIAENWLAFGIASSNPTANSFVGMDAAGVMNTQRQETLEIACSFYGPEALEFYTLVRDGLQIQQNLDALRAARMGYTDISQALHLPDLVNERFFNRYETTIQLQREIQRRYPIVSILSATGTIHTVLGDEEYLLEWQTPEEE